MTVDEEKVLRQMMHHNAVLMGAGFGGVIAAYPSGNRRRKPVCWMESESVDHMVVKGWLSKANDRIQVSGQTRSHLARESARNGSANPHMQTRKQDVYSPDSNRPAQVNRRLTVLQRLGRRLDHNGVPILSAAQVEAGRHFARDYMKGGLGYAATQNYAASGADTSERHSRMENAVISGVDRRKRVGEAIACLGPGLDRAVIAVCCDDWSLDAVERSENWAKNSGKTILIMALDRLAHFYGTQPGVNARR